MSIVDLRAGLRNYILSNSAIAAMVSDRVFPVKVKDGVRDDCIVYFRSTELETYNFIAPSGLVTARMQIDSWSQSADRSFRLADLVKEHLGGFSGNMSYGGSSPNDFVTVQGIFILSGFEDFDQESKLYRTSRDYGIVYEDRQ